MEEIKNIELCFENCEVHTYKGEYVEKIVLNDIREIQSDYYENSFMADEFYLKLKPQANNVRNVDENFADWSKNPFARIVSHEDLCHVDITYIDESIEQYNVNWSDDNDWQSNSYQKSLIDVDGSLHISVHARNKEE